ncbi:DUF3592 domain-containing protein [bacterium]|nr:DUF3592 domain-containing protein [bacterium]
MNYLIAIGFISVFLLIAMACVIYSMRQLITGWRSLKWSSVPGVFVDGRIEKTEHRSKNGNKTFYEVCVAYKYKVAGQTFRGNVITPGYAGTTDLEEETRLLEWLQSTPSFQVFHDPLHPEKSVLVPGIDRGMFTYMLVGVILLLAAIGIGTSNYLLNFGESDLLQSIVTR